MIDSQKTLVAYLDILGYKEIIENETPEEFYESIVHTFKAMQQLIDSLYAIETKSKVKLGQITAEAVKTVRFKILSDTIIIYWDFNDIERINKQYYKEIDYELSGTALFFHVVSTVVLLFIARTGHLLRGGVCLGKFHTNTFDSCLIDGEFIFSEALVRGYELEQLANHPRILVGETLYNLWESKPESVKNHRLVKGLINRDKDGELYLDFYEPLRDFTVDAKKNWLVDIIKQVNNMLAVKQDDKRVWKKWYWFKEYHNEKIRSFAESEKQDLNELLIN